MLRELETDYLVVGAGAAGMAFTDALLTHSSATVTLVDRRDAPGGHWIDAYPFVRLHQPSVLYGVDSVALGHHSIDPVGTNAGFYELAGADELRDYYGRVLHRHFLPSQRVHYFPCTDYLGGNRLVSRLSGASCQVRVRRKVVDTTYLEGAIPATSPPPFERADGVRCVTPGELSRLERPAERFVIIGAGKTALDTGVWLLEHGVSPAAIRWVRPRDGWWMNRRFQQPLTLLSDFIHGNAVQVEAMAEASSVEAVCARLESEGILLRLDSDTVPTMLHGAIASEGEIELLRQIKGVIRLGHVRRIERHEILLDHGRVPTDEGTVHIHCASRGLARPPPRPIFEAERVTIQPYSWGFACFQFATLGVVEALVDGDEAKNALCPAMSYWDTPGDYLAAFLAGMTFTLAVGGHPSVAAWCKASRLNPMSGLGSQRGDPRVVAARERIKRWALPAATNLQQLLAARS